MLLAIQDADLDESELNKLVGINSAYRLCRQAWATYGRYHEYNILKVGNDAERVGILNAIRQAMQKPNQSSISYTISNDQPLTPS